MIEYIVNKRVKNLDYLKRVHEGHVLWLNIVKIQTSDIERFYQPQTLQKRVQQWFHLGMSIAPLLNSEHGWCFLRACSQLMEEYEYHFANAAVQGMKILKSIKFTSSDEEMSKHAIKPSINKVSGNVAYEFLKLPNIPCILDYTQVVYSLCDILTLVYQKMMDDSSMQFCEAVLKLDSRFKHHFFGLISRDLNTLATYVAKSRLSLVEALFTSSYPQKLNEDVVPYLVAPSTPSKKLHLSTELDDEVDEWAEAFPE